MYFVFDLFLHHLQQHSFKPIKIRTEFVIIHHSFSQAFRSMAFLVLSLLSVSERWFDNIKISGQKISSCGIKMNNKNKNTSKRKESHSRQHNSHLRSSSKSHEKSKHRSDSKLLLRLRNHQASQLPSAEEKSNPNQNSAIGNSLLARMAASKKNVQNGKQVQNSSSEYYNHRVKSKSRGKLVGAEQEVKAIYLNSIYMHKDTGEASNNVSQHEHLNKHEEVPQHHSTHALNKIKLIQRNGAIDANGKFVVKDKEHSRNHHDHPKNSDSVQTLSMFEGERRRPRKKEKTRKQTIRTKRKDEGRPKNEDEGRPKNAETSRLAGIKSADKFVKKPKEFISPLLQNLTLRHYDCEASTAQEHKENAYKVREKEREAPAPILSTRTSKTILSEQTQTSPQLAESNKPPAAQQINLDYVLRELNEDKVFRFPPAKLKQVYSGMQIERVKCIEFIAKLCLSLSIRREAHSLAVIVMDRFLLTSPQPAKELRLLAMASLLLALKVDDGIMSRKLCHQYSTRMEMILGMSTRSSNQSKSIMKYKEAISAFSSKETSASALSKSKSLSNSELAITKQIKKSRKEEGQSREMGIILGLQLEMLVRFNFRLVHRTSTYWADVLTLLWDDYIFEEADWEADLLFRNERNRRNLSHCYQLLQRSSLDLESYHYSPPLLVLSAMYLVLRMRLEEQQGQQQHQIYARFATSLAKSTNLIFYDAVGANELFGDFLGELQMTLSEIIQCIQFVGRGATVPMKTFNFNTRSHFANCRTYEHQLAIYQGNSQTYKFVEDQY